MVASAQRHPPAQIPYLFMTDRGSPATHPEAASTQSSSLDRHADTRGDAGFDPGHAGVSGTTDAAGASGTERHDPTPLALRIVRFLPRAVIVALMVLAGLLLVGTVYPISGARGRDLLNRTWSRCLLWVCGVRLAVRGQPLMRGPVLFVANHVSWLDIFVINAVRPTAFVAKSEIRRWPIVGWLVAGAGTLFLQRGHRQAIHATGNAMKARFANDEAVGLFPEGTTTEGFSLLPFHGSLFEPAKHAGVTIQPVALRFLLDGQRSAFAAFVGEETLVGNLWRVLGATGLSVETAYCEPLAPHGEDGTVLGRVELAMRARACIRDALEEARR
jgi:1-acyl-sn-glycerol-3-phosphate acyltransferase